MGSSAAPMVVGGVIVGLLIFTGVMVGVSLKKLASDEVALMYDVHQKKLHETPMYEGLHSGTPGFTFIKFPSVFKTFSYAGLSCLNHDGVKIRLDISYQSRIRPAQLYTTIKQFKDYEEYKDVLEAFGASAIHEACSKFNTSQFQSQRGMFQEAVRERLVEKYDVVDSDITDLQVKDIVRPSEYEAAIRKKEGAREDIQVAEQERERQLVEAETREREAKTQATITMNKALSDARVIKNKAKTEAETILTEFKQEASVYKQLVTDLSLSTEGFLAYLGTRAIEGSDSAVHVNMDAPARTSWMNS